MGIIEQLQYHESNQMEEWYDIEGKEETKLLRDIVAFAKSNETELKEYCTNLIPTDFSSLSIVYEALSEYSTDFNAFLYDEIKRVVTLAKEGKMNPEFIEVLSDIESEDIYSKDLEVYIKIMNFLSESLDISNEDECNIQILDIMDWFFIEIDEDEKIEELTSWVTKIIELATNGNSNVQSKAEDVLFELNFDIEYPDNSQHKKLEPVKLATDNKGSGLFIKPKSFTEKVKSWFS